MTNNNTSPANVNSPNPINAESGQNQTPQLYTTRQVATLLRITPRRVRAYSRLMAGTRHTRNGFRLFTPNQLDQISDILFMKTHKFSTAEIKKFLSLSHSPASKAFLNTRKRQFRQEIVELQECIDFIERKEENFDDPSRP